MAKIYYATKEKYQVFGKQDKSAINANKIKVLLGVIDRGLSHGLGNPTPGQMCVQAAVCNVMGEGHGDRPNCVDWIVTQFGILLNDRLGVDVSKSLRAKALRRLAVAELGSAGLPHDALVAKISENLRRECDIHVNSGGVGFDEGLTAQLRGKSPITRFEIVQKVADVIAMTLKEMNSPGAAYLEMTCESK